MTVDSELSYSEPESIFWICVFFPTQPRHLQVYMQHFLALRLHTTETSCCPREGCVSGTDDGPTYITAECLLSPFQLSLSLTNPYARSLFSLA